MNPNPPMTTPTEQEIRAALEEHAVRKDWGDWAFHAHPLNYYNEAQALRLAKVNLMLGTTPNGSLTTEMIERIVDRIAALEWTAEMGA
jgi:hypothetical protein